MNSRLFAAFAAPVLAVSVSACGINSVPAIVIDGRYLISGGQPPEAFERALRQIVAEAA